jgi:ABC-type transport system involved in multi-copper enzyme maturation permease subunit
MLTGPVFEFELLTTARRGRYYVARAGYALLILFVIYHLYQGWFAGRVEELSLREVREFALWAFGALAALQMLMVLGLTPALTAGVVAAEKQSKTLHYVMASPLSGVEVVLGKLLSRMLHVGVFLGVGFPILSLLVLLGGLDPKLVVLGCAASASAAFFLAALAVLASVYARRVREALFLAYAVELLWLIGPELFARFIPLLGVFGVPLSPLSDWLFLLSPLSVGRDVAVGMFTGATAFLDSLFWMIGLQVAAGTVLVALAAWRVRPVFRKQEGGARAAATIGGDGRASSRRTREVPDDGPMAWKERHAVRGTRLTRLVGAAVAVAVIVPIVYQFGPLALAAFFENLEDPSGPLSWSYYASRLRLHMFVQSAVGCVAFLTLVHVAASAAGSVTSEHEGDTWVSLTATDLTAGEVVGAKLFGAVWAARRLLVALAILVAIGAACGAVHPVGVAAVAVSVAAFVAFAAALGLWVSFQFRSTWRAQFLAVATLLLVNLIGQAVVGVFWPYDPPATWPGFMAGHAATSVYGPGDLPQLLDEAWRGRSGSSLPYPWRRSLYSRAVHDALAVVTYAALAAGLTWASLLAFDRVAGRPKRAGRWLREGVRRTALPEAVGAGAADR